MRVVSIIQAKRVQLFWQNNRGLSMANHRKSTLGFLGFLCFPGSLVGNERFLRKNRKIRRYSPNDSSACLLVCPPANFSNLPATFQICPLLFGFRGNDTQQAILLTLKQLADEFHQATIEPPS